MKTLKVLPVMLIGTLCCTSINDMWVSENGLDPKNDLNGENDDKRLRTVSSERRSHMVPLFSDGTGIIGESWILGGLRGAASTC